MYLLHRIIFTGLIFIFWELNAQVALPTFQGTQTPNLYAPGSQTFSYTGAQQTFTVPSGVSTITIKAWGAQGGNVTSYRAQDGGKGGYATGNLSVSTGNTLYVYVGGQGANRLGNHPYPDCELVNGGFNGGGKNRSAGTGTPGGGASDIRSGGTALANRVIVAGGGGGCGWTLAQGGAGVGTTGQNGTDSNSSGTGGYGGTQSAGGAIGNASSGSCTKSAGSLGVGGDGGGYTAGGGAGGGGYYGGGGGGYSEGGGGGSSYIGGVSSGGTTAGNASMPNPDGGTMTGREGNGVIIISW